VGAALQGRACALPVGVETGLSPSQGIVGGVSSFGYSGTIVHVVLCSRGTGSLLPARSPSYCRRPFLWHIAKDGLATDASVGMVCKYTTAWIVSATPAEQPSATSAQTWLLTSQATGPASVEMGHVPTAQYEGIVMSVQPLDAAVPRLTDVLVLLAIVQSLLQLSKAPQLAFVTSGVQRPVGRAAGTAMAGSLFAGGAWGFGRVLQLEAPALTATAADQPFGPASEAAARALISGASGSANKERLLAWSCLECHTVRLRRGVSVPSVQEAAMGACGSAAYAITGAYRRPFLSSRRPPQRYSALPSDPDMPPALSCLQVGWAGLGCRRRRCSQGWERHAWCSHHAAAESHGTVRASQRRWSS
jgi:hypothetical protein